MKKYSLLGGCVIALAAITAPPAWGASEIKSLEELIPFAPRRFVEIGMERPSVLLTLGLPSAKLSPDVWVYFDFHPGNVRDARVINGEPEKIDTAIVTFKNGRVAEIRLCDSKPVRAFLAELQRTARSRQPVPPRTQDQTTGSSRSVPADTLVRRAPGPAAGKSPSDVVARGALVERGSAPQSPALPRPSGMP